MEPGGSINNTGAAAEGYLRQEALYSRLLRLFREHRPDRAQLEQVATLTSVVHSRVSQLHRDAPAADAVLWDAAECGSLYGFMLGYWAAQAERSAQEERTV